MMPDEEFDNPDVNYYVLSQELKQRIQNIQLDMQSIRDPELRGCAEKLYTELKAEFFRLSKDYIALVAMTQDVENNEEKKVN